MYKTLTKERERERERGGPHLSHTIEAHVQLLPEVVLYFHPQFLLFFTEVSQSFKVSHRLIQLLYLLFQLKVLVCELLHHLLCSQGIVNLLLQLINDSLCLLPVDEGREALHVQCHVSEYRSVYSIYREGIPLLP